jgi:uncharacterized repeat protein (TIGR01451 family)
MTHLSIRFFRMLALLLLALVAGSATVFAQETVLSYSPVTTGDWFGRSVDIDGSRLVVGAALYDPVVPTLNNAGAAFVFVNSGGTWVQEARLTASGLALDAGDNLGQAVAISGNRVVSGAYSAERTGPSLGAAGRAYVWERDGGGTWNRTELIPGDPQANVNYGYAVDIDGNTIVVGAYNFDITAPLNNAGAVYVFVYDGANWVQQAKLLAPVADQVSMMRFGYSVSIDGDNLLVGAMGPVNTTGKAYAFTRSGTTWSSPVQLPAPTVANNDGYGQTVALDYPNAIVTANARVTTGVTATGTAYVYQYDGASWNQTAQLTPANLENFAYFGFSAAIKGNSIYVGARADTHSTFASAGSVSSWIWNGASWVFDQTRISSTPGLNAFFGGGVAFDGANLLVGEYGERVAGVNFSGSASVFSIVPPADVQVTKTLTTVAPFLEGQSISYTIDVLNNGPSTATNINVTDTPTNLTITSVSGACAAFPCTIASLASGASASITVAATINAPGAFDNSVTVAATEPDSNSANNTDNTGNGGTAGAVANVSIVKTLTTVGPYVHGQVVTYTLDVANAGPSTATNVNVTDTPTNLTITGVSGAGCAALPCLIASLPVGTVQITVTATIDAPGAFDNSAAATGAESDPDLTNNSDNVGNGGTAAASTDLSVVKTLTTAGPYIDGQSISYTIDVANAGPSTATNVQVVDTPTNLTVTAVSGGGCAALPCTIPTLASAASVQLTVTATIASAGAFDNAATVSGTEGDPNLANNTDNSGNGGVADASSDISIVKTLTTAGPWFAGQSVAYTLDVTNSGPSPATNVGVTDTPTNLTITTVAGAGCAALPCTLPTLASGATATINVTALTTAAGAFDNSATVTATENDPNLANNTDSTTNGGVAAESADVSVVKTLTTLAPFNAGQSVSFTILVANAGPSTATNIGLTDSPTNLTITAVSGGGCAALPCTIPSLASGASVLVDVTATIVAAIPFDNGATVTATENDPNPANNSDASGNGGTVGTASDLAIVKTLTTVAPFTAGQSVSYTIAVSNNGPSTATNVNITDTPTNLTITAVGGACATLPCTIPTLATGATANVTLTAVIAAAGAFDNGASVAATESDPNPANNSDSGNGGVAAASADVSVVKSLVSAAPYRAGQPATFTITVANAGPSPATSINVADTPTNLTITNVSGACAALPCTVANLASGANAVINVTATVVAAGAFDNGVTVAATEGDPNLANNADASGNGATAEASADVSMVKTLLTAGPFSAGQSVSYTLVVANAGPSTATTINVTDTPSNLTITAVSGGCAALPCTIATLASGASVTIDVTATINTSASFENGATATGAEHDPNLTNNDDLTGNGGGIGDADVSVTKTLVSVAPFFATMPVEYTIVVSNAGTATATSIVITDTPLNMTITSVSGACAALPCTLPILAAGASATINVTATITAAGTFDNGVTVAAVENDPNTANNSDPNGNGGEAQEATAIPTASTTVLLLLAAVLAVAGATVLRRV